MKQQFFPQRLFMDMKRLIINRLVGLGLLVVGALVSCNAPTAFVPVPSPNPWMDDYTALSSMENYKQWGTYNVHDPACKKVMLAVNDIEKAFSHGNPWLMKFRAISIPETLERTHLKEWLGHVWIVDFEQVEVILQESEWKRFFPEEWLNNGEEDCNGKKE